MRTLAAFALMAGTIAPGFGQAEAFRRTFAAPSNHSDVATAAAVTSTGLAYVAGRAYDPGTASEVGYLLAYDAKGLLLWARSQPVLGGSATPERLAVSTGSRDVWMASRVNVGNGWAVRVQRVSPSGVLLFQVDVPGSSFSLDPCALVVDGFGNAYLTDEVGSQPYVAKIGPAGQLLWQTWLVGGSGAQGTGIALVSSSGVVATGIRADVQGGYYAARLDSDGALVWSKFDAGQIGNTLGPSFVETAEGVVVVATNPESSFGITQYRIARLNLSDGTTLWSQDYSPNPMNDAKAAGLSLDRAGNAYVCARRIVPFTGAVVKYSPGGGRLWEANPSDAGSALATDPLGGVLVCSWDGWVRRFAASGQETYARRHSGDSLETIAANALGRTVAVGSSNLDFVAVGVLVGPVAR
jgi:hypothetical protein